MTSEGYNKLLSFEEERFSAYQNSLGYWSIGRGHCIDDRCGCGISRDISRRLFEDDLVRYTATARANFDWFDALDPVRQDVVVMLLFNLGATGLNTFHLMLKAIGDHAWHEAAFQLANSLWGRQVGFERKKETCAALELGRWS
jgi:GH24 family phage-related lysozyme (muramidase)